MSIRTIAILWPALLLGAAAAAAQPSSNSSANWVTAGPVHAVARSGSTVYFGGQFNAVAPKSEQTGAFAFTFGEGCRPPAISGTVNAIVSDGANGWFVGGSFSRVGGGNRSNLVHFIGCTVNWEWTGAVNGRIDALSLSDGILYVGGEFSQAGQQGDGFVARANLAAFSVVSGLLTSWNPGANGPVHALEAFTFASPDIVTHVYVGGAFSQLAGAPRQRLGAVDHAGSVTPFTADADGSVLALDVEALDAGPAPARVWVGGEFTTIGSVTRHRLAMISIAIGTVDPAFNPDVNAPVRALLVARTTLTSAVIYVGGEFTQIGSTSRNHLAALSSSGAPLPFDPSPDGPVFAIDIEYLALPSAPVYVGGRFTRIGNVTRLNAAAVQASTGGVGEWNPSFDGDVRALAASSQVAAGGSFNAVGAHRRQSLAAVNLDTGELLPFNPEINGGVNSIVVRDDVVYVGGEFTRVGSDTRRRLAAFGPVTRALTPWNPDADDVVTTLYVSGRVIYVGGDFGHVGTTPRGRLAAVDAITASVVTTFVPPEFDAAVNALALQDGLLYVGGLFTSASSVSARHLTRLNAATGARDAAWLPDADGPVRALCSRPTVMYVGGAFGMIGAAPRANLAAVALTSGIATDWQPNPDGTVHAIACSSQVVYAGGEFVTIGAGPPQARPRLAALAVTATGPSATYATSFRVRTPGVVRAAVLASDGLLVGATGDPFVDEDEPVLRIGFFPEDFTGSPAPPSGVTASQGGGVLRIRWSPPVRGPRPTSYLLEMGSAFGASNLLNGLRVTGTEFQFTSAGLPPYLTAFIRVRAATADGASRPSDELAMMSSTIGRSPIFGIFRIPCEAPPKPPREFAAALTDPSATFTWAPGTGNSYRFEAGSASGRTDVAVATTETSFTASAPPGMYYTRVRSVATCGISLASSEIVLFVGGAAAPPSAPINMSATVGAPNTVTITWDHPALGSASSYRLEAGRGFGRSDIAVTTVSGTRLDVGNVPSGTYYLRVYAVGPAGTGPSSDEVILVVP